MKILKCLLLSLLVCCLLTSFNLYTEAAPKVATGNLKYKNKSDLVKSDYDVSLIQNSSIYTPKLKKGCVIVNIKTICDESYRKAHSKDWAARARKTVHQAGVDICTKFNIYYNAKKGVKWTSGNIKEPSKLLENIWDTYGLNSNSKDQMVVGFTKKESGNTLGIGYIGAPYALVCSTYFKTDVQTAQHETGHNYELQHCSDKKCTMYPFSNVQNTGRFCKAHTTQWKQNRTLY